jgi:hypothetical protein
MSGTRALIIGAACLVAMFVGLMLGYDNDRKLTDEEKKKPPQHFGFLDFDRFKERVMSETKVFTQEKAHIVVDSVCNDKKPKPLRIVEFRLDKRLPVDTSLRVVYELDRSASARLNCSAPKGLADRQELCLYSSDPEDDDAEPPGKCEANLFDEGAISVGPGPGRIELLLVKPSDVLQPPALRVIVR